MENSKRTIAIVCGGDSSEHDVSLRSGQGLYSFFDKERYNIYLVDVKGTDWHVAFDNGETAEIDKNDFSFVKDGKHVYFDYAYITIHGQPGENGVMQGYFDLIHLPYSTSGVLVEAMTFDKYVLNNYLRGFGVNDEKMEQFRDYLTSHGVFTTIRASRGQDIYAACGLLSTSKKIGEIRQHEDEEKKE